MSAAVEVRVPNIGDFKDVPIIDVLVKPGDSVDADAPIVTLESEKASIDVPSPSAGVVESVAVKVGDKVSEGSVLIALAAADGAGASATQPVAPPQAQPAGSPQAQPVASPQAEQPPAEATAQTPPAESKRPDTQNGAAVAPLVEEEPGADGAMHASPSVRRFARELGVPLASVRGSGPHGRIAREDVQSFVKTALASPRTVSSGAAIAGLNLPPWPKVDFAQYGPVERVALTRIKRIAGPNLHRNWVMIPHVTNNDEADVTELEAFRQALNAEDPKAKLTILAFAIKAVVAALRRFPDFNASLDGDELVLKRYYHVGFAADTPNGLVVPVLRDADKKGVLAIATETRELAAKARDGKLSLAEMQGGTFTISSLGGIGGTSFSPIINAPEVAILGVSRSATRPVWDGEQFVPRLMLPLSLSYDHRVIDGAAAARFNAYLASILADFRRTVL